MHKERLQNARDYFDNVTAVAYRQFMQSEVTFLVVHSMAASLFHLAEWVYVHDRAKIQAKYGTQIRYGGELWDKVVGAKVTDADLIRNLATTAKHVKLRFYSNKASKDDPFAGTHQPGRTFISTSPFRDDGQRTYGGSREVSMDEGGREVQLEPIATAVFKFWETLIDEFYPKTADTNSAGSKAARSATLNRLRPVEPALPSPALPSKVRF
jgi:hypothetical protein